MHKTLGEELKLFGGYLECSVCNNKSPLGNVGNQLSNGWKTCCGLTMTWIAQKKIDEK